MCFACLYRVAVKDLQTWMFSTIVNALYELDAKIYEQIDFLNYEEFHCVMPIVVHIVEKVLKKGIDKCMPFIIIPR